MELSRHHFLQFGAVAIVTAASFQVAWGQTLTTVGKPTTTTAIGQPIEFPTPAEVSSYVAEVPVGTFPFHTHPYQRFFYVLAGTLTVEDEAGKKYEYPVGSMVVEMRNTYHRPVNNGPDPVKVFVIDVSKPGEPNQLSKP